MNWFDRLTANRYIELVLLANNQGRLLRSSREINSDDELLPSMLQALEVLAQTLATELGCGPAQLVQLSTSRGHLLLFPLIDSTYYLAVMIERAAPLMLILVELERTIKNLTLEDVAEFDDNGELNAAELIEAVRQWLRGKP